MSELDNSEYLQVPQDKSAADLAPAVPNTGGNSNIYLLDIQAPKRLYPYQVEAEDIIEEMEMPFADATVFKSNWRLSQARRGRGKPGNSRLYEAEKMLYYSMRVWVREMKLEGRKITQRLVNKIVNADVFPGNEE